MPVDNRNDRRIELSAGSASHHGDGGRGSTHPLGYFDVLGKLNDSRCNRDLVSPELAGPAPAVPPFVRGGHRVLYAGVETETSRESAGQRGVSLDHVIQLAVAEGRESYRDSQPVRRG